MCEGRGGRGRRGERERERERGKESGEKGGGEYEAKEMRVIQLFIFGCLHSLWFSLHYSYLHENKIVHGNVSLATIFIQHNGLVKIGSGM